MLLLFTRGRRSGKTRTTPLLYLADGEELVVVASYGGAPQHPAWYLNLSAEPDVDVLVGRQRITAHARAATEEERGRFWPQFVELYPGYETYRGRTTRMIPLVVLTPRA